MKTTYYIETWKPLPAVAPARHTAALASWLEAAPDGRVVNPIAVKPAVYTPEAQTVPDRKAARSWWPWARG